MTEPLKIKFTIAKLDDAPKPLQLFYESAEDGTFHLRVEGEPPGYVTTDKLDEFRDNNRSLNATKTELETRLATFDGIDPVAAKAALAKPDVTPKLTELEAALAAERTAHQQTLFKNLVAFDFLKSGGQPGALDFIVAKAAQVFSMKDGQVVTPAFSATHPGVPLSVPEWITSQMTDAAFAFLPSRGGGAAPTGGGLPARRTVDSRDPFAFGQNLADIASGKVDVR